MLLQGSLGFQGLNIPRDSPLRLAAAALGAQLAAGVLWTPRWKKQRRYETERGEFGVTNLRKSGGSD